MMNTSRIYRRLRKHMNRQAVGYPRSMKGSEVNILKHLFTPEQAILALSMSFRYRSLDQIVQYSDQQFAGKEARGLLEGMLKGRAIFWRQVDSVDQYALAPLVVGMYELNIGKMTPELVEDLVSYFSSTAYGISMINTEYSQMRTIPIEEVITPEHRVAPYNDVKRLVMESPGPFSFVECICRQKQGLLGRECKVTPHEEVCLTMGSMAQQVIRLSAGIEVSRSEALTQLRRHADLGLIFQPSGGQIPEFICSCCSCCCGMLGFINQVPRPAEFWSHSYYAVVSPEDCVGCGLCEDICKVNAISIVENVSRVDPQRCIGCGHCVPKCPSDAISFEKSEYDIILPTTQDDLYDKIREHRPSGLGAIFTGIKLKIGKKWHNYHHR